MIQRTPNGTLPNLPLNGQWLSDLGFTVGRGVHASFANSCLTLTIGDASTNLLVESRMVHKRPRTHLIINAFWLKKCGFHIGDRVGLTLAYGKIQIHKINRFTTVAPTA